MHDAIAAALSSSDMKKPRVNLITAGGVIDLPEPLESGDLPDLLLWIGGGGSIELLLLPPSPLEPFFAERRIPLEAPALFRLPVALETKPCCGVVPAPAAAVSALAVCAAIAYDCDALLEPY